MLRVFFHNVLRSHPLQRYSHSAVDIVYYLKILVPSLGNEQFIWYIFNSVADLHRHPA
jgi:hypothetical protein